jgi:Domain of Unknown Function (DUF1080)
MTRASSHDRRAPLRTTLTAVTCGLLLLTQCLAAEPRADGDGWIELFDGKTLNGWHKNPEKIGHGTGGRWTVEPGGVLAGEQDPPGSGNGGILLTDRKFGDFELSLEMKPNWGSDSGLFLRTTDKGQCIQMMVDYYNGGSVGHFYGEATGGWGARTFSLRGDEENGKVPKLTTTSPQAAEDVGLAEACTPEEWLKAWKIGDWNKALVRVEGGRFPVITTYINGVKVGVFDAANSKAEKYDREEVARLLGEEGSVALQVHGGDSYPPGAKCRWRNIRIREL